MEIDAIDFSDDLVAYVSLPISTDSEESLVEHPFLNENFSVYVKDSVVTNNPMSQTMGFNATTLPTKNHYTGPNGGYVAIYTRNAENGIYTVGNGIYVIGQLRVEGKYEGRIFVPEGYQLGDDITQDQEILTICDKYFPHMSGKMWIGGDTGGWYGISPSQSDE